LVIAWGSSGSQLRVEGVRRACPGTTECASIRRSPDTIPLVYQPQHTGLESCTDVLCPTGTFQQYVTGPANYVTPIPESLSSDMAAPMLCAGVTVYSALRKCGAESGNWVVLMGAGGGLGHLAVQIAAKGMGFRVIGIDAGSKKDFALQCGAEVFIDHETQNAEEEVKKVTGGLGAQSVLVLTAANGAYAMSMNLLKFGGTTVCVGLPEGELKAIATAFPQVMVAKELSIRGVAVGDRREAIETLEFAERGIVKTHFRTEKMDKLTSIFEEMERGELKGRVVLDLTA
jgi:alcohol dehydrogenase, propanol-preferring